MVKLFFKERRILVALIIIIILTCGQVTFEFLIPTLMGYIIAIVNDPMRQTLLIDIVMFSLYMILAALGSLIMNVFISWISSRTTIDILSKMRCELHKKVSSFSLIELNQFGIGSLITRTTSDITMVSNVFTTLLHNISHGPLLLIGSLVFLIFEGCDYQLILIIVVATVLLSLLVYIGAKIVIPRFDIIEKNVDDINTISKENLDGLRVIRAYNAESYQEAKFNKINENYFKNERFANRVLGLLTPTIQFVTGAVTLAITLVSALLIKDPKNDLNYEKMAVIIQFGGLILSGFITIMIIIAIVPRASICIRRINEILLTEPAINYHNNSDVKTKQVGTIKFDDVTFTYPGCHNPTIHNINFEIEKGKTIAFIGMSGSGKTTIVNLLLHLYEPQKGNVLVDGININRCSPNWLHKRVAWVPQKSFLFYDTIKNNICLGKPNATSKEILDALQMSQSLEFIKKMSDGINHQISEGGKNISGGQRQRLCIARALLCKPEILILDDSYSALDYKTVKLINSAIRLNQKNITTMIISQRVSAIMHADTIVVLDKGKIVGKGQHRDLLKTCREYYNFATTQLNIKELLL